jgi:uncharacterized protein YbjT (DUF2867 family)
MRVLVTGGSGSLGSEVVAELARRGHEARPASRRTGVDLSTGRGLAEAVAGVEAVVHCATAPQGPRRVDVDGTGRLVAELARRPAPPHLVFVSIVGCDRSPFPYYRAKTEVEQRLARWAGPATVVRATQFHPFAAAVAQLLMVGPVAFSIGDMAVQPADTAWVAGHLVDIATGPVPGGFSRATDLAGPDVLTMSEVATMLREHTGRSSPRVVRVPPVGGVLRSFSEGVVLPPGAVETGGRSFAHWLETQPPRLPPLRR